MAEVTAAIRAMHFGAGHEKAAVGGGSHRPLQGLPEAGPARAALVLGRGIEEPLAAAGAEEGAGALLGVQRAAARPLRAVLAQHAIALGRKFAAPCLIRLLDRVVLGG